METIPAASEGFIPTLNRMGFMTVGLDPYSQAFVSFSAAAPGPSLDIGAAYGVASIAALKQGASLIANDLDERHLRLLKEKVPADVQSKLQLLAGKFPENLDFDPESLGAVLACRILHFLDGKRLTQGLEKIYRWLKPGGKCFLVAETIYIRTFQSVIPLYEARKAVGEHWPGYFDNVHEIVPELKDKLPPTMHLLDVDVLTRVLEDTGFRVEQAATIARTDFPRWLQWDGRESVGVIAVK